MKRALSFSLTLSLLPLVGCSTTSELSVEHDARRLAPILGVEASDIQFLCYGDFSLFEEPKRKKTVTLDGIIALSESDLHLIIPKRYLFSDKVVTVPVDETEAIANSSYQIQLMHQGDRIVIELRDASSLELIKQNYQTVLDFYRKRGVPEYEAGRSWDIIDARAQIGARRYDGGDWAPMRDNNSDSRSYGSPYPVGGSHDIE